MTNQKAVKRKDQGSFHAHETRQARAEFVPGALCIVDGHTVQIDGWDSLTQVRIRNLATGHLSTVGMTRLEPLPTSPKAKEAGHVGEAEWERCVALARDFEATGDPARLSAVQWKELSRAHKLSARQLQRLRQAYLAMPAVTTLVRDSGGRPEGTSRLLPEVDALVAKIVEKHYLIREGASKVEIVYRVRAVARRLGLQAPSRNAILLRIARLSPAKADKARRGSRAASQRWDARPGQLQVDHPLDLVQIDHTPADLLVLSDDRREVIGRPWVTVCIDVASRCVLGLYVSMDTPSSVSVALCIEHSVLPKPALGGQSDLWPMFGKPKGILVDNGKDFQARALIRGCEEHGILLTFRPVRRPHYGAHIERLLGSLMSLTHRLPGTTFSNTGQRGDYNSAARAELTLNEYRDWLTVTICRYYHVRRHRALTIPPLVAWERAFTKTDGTFVAPPLLQRPLEFRIDFLPLRWRKVQRTGIELSVTRYWHDDLAELIGQLVAIRYHPAEPLQIYVRRPDGLLVTAAAIAGRAVEIRPQPKLDAATRARMEQLMADGFLSGDEICAIARQATRRAQRQPKPTLQPEPPQTKIAPTELALPQIPGALTAEIWTEGSLR